MGTASAAVISPPPGDTVLRIAPQLTDAELVTLAMMQAMLGFTSEARWLRHARVHLRHLFPYLPQQPGYNKRLRKAAELLRRVTRILATSTSAWSDDVWTVDSTPVECGRSRETVKRSDLAGWASTATAPVTAASSGACGCTWCAPSRACPSPSPSPGPRPMSGRPCWTRARPNRTSSPPGSGQTLIGDKNYFGRDFEQELTQQGIQLLRPTRKGESLFKSLRQVIESVNEIFKGQLDLEQHRGRTPHGVIARVMQRILALTAVIWHNDHAGQDALRSLTPYDH
jgi:hypothetical protein